MKIYTSKLGVQYFLVFEDVISIPINKIIKFDLSAKNGGASDNSVCIYYEDQEIYFAYENADAIRKYLVDNKIV